MTELPSGTVTFLFTDIEGSTVLLRRLRTRYGDVLADHQQLLRDAVAEAGGNEIDSQGDSFFFVFRRARDAVIAAANAQRALAAHAWPEDGVVRVRMGIHTGEAAFVDGRYVGVAVHRASRISAAGHGGQVLLSQTTHNLFEDEEELPLDLRDLGEQRLKDFERPVRVHQLVIPGLQERFPPLSTLDRHDEPAGPAVQAELPTWRRLAGRKWVLIGLVAALVAGALAAGLALIIPGAGSASLASQSVGAIDPKRNAVVGDVQLGSPPTALAVGEGGVWAISTEAKTLTRIDPASKATRTIALPGIPSDVAAGAGAVWVVHSSSLQPTSPGEAGSIVSRIDPRYLDVQKTIDTGAAFDDTTYADPIAVGRLVWVGAGGTANVAPYYYDKGAYGLIVRINPANNEVAGHLAVRGGVYGPGALVADRAATWAVTGQGVIRIDARTKGLTEVPGPGTTGPSIATTAFLIALGEGKVWAAGDVRKRCGSFNPEACERLPGILWRIDPATNGVDAQTRIAVDPAAVAVGGGAVWVADRVTKSV